MMNQNVMRDPLRAGMEARAHGLPKLLLGVAAALLSGIAAIRLLRYITKNKSFTPFSIYCALAGAAVIAADLLR